MLIVCDNCGAEYQVDIDDEGGTPARQQRFRCSACGHTFSIASERSKALDSESPEDGKAGHEPTTVMYLQQEGKVYQIDDLAALQRWIVERRVLREDLLSVGGLKWEPVGSRRDLQVFFHLVEHAERSVISGGSSAPPPLSEDSGRDPLAGKAPWEMGAGVPSSAPTGQAAADLDDLSAPEADPDELDHDDGTDAGLPVLDLGALSRSRELDEEALSAPEPRFAQPVVMPNLAGPDLAGPELRPELRPEPAVAAALSSPPAADGSALSSDMLFPDETEELQRTSSHRPYEAEVEPAASSGGVPVWAVLLGLAVLLGGGAWWYSTHGGTDTPVDSPSTPTEAVIRPGAPPAVAQPVAAPVAQPVAQPVAAPVAAPVKPPEPVAAPKPPPEPAPEAAPKPVSAQKRVEQGWAAADKGNFSEAQAHFAAAVESNPSNGAAVFGLGYSYEKLGNSALAVRYYCTASRSNNSEAQLEAQGRLRALGASCE